MRQVVFVAVLGIAASLFIGCGGDGDASSEAKTSKAESLLVRTSELPDGTATGEVPPTMCGPLPVLQENGGQIALSNMFVVDSARLVEAVGVFRTPAKARSAFDDLNDPERLECIANAIRAFSSASEVEIIEPRPLKVGDEGSLARYASFDEESEEEGGKPSGHSDVVAVRVGRCTASLLIAVKGGDPPDVISGEITEVVVRRLMKTCGS